MTHQLTSNCGKSTPLLTLLVLQDCFCPGGFSLWTERERLKLGWDLELEGVSDTGNYPTVLRE